jgi:8-oxo-dGTP diphosphatase
MSEYKYPYPMAAITADLVVFSKSESDFYFCGITRKNEPFAGMVALPGGFVNLDKETVLQALIRETKEETTIEVGENCLAFIGYYDAVKRDPRGRVISMAYYCLMEHHYMDQCVAGDDAASIAWVRVQDVLDGKVKMAFDHEQILQDAFLKTFS